MFLVIILNGPEHQESPPKASKGSVKLSDCSSKNDKGEHACMHRACATVHVVEAPSLRAKG